MNEQWIATVAATHMDVDEALNQVERAEKLAIVLSRAGRALKAEVARLQAIEQRARDELTGTNLHAAVVAERILGEDKS